MYAGDEQLSDQEQNPELYDEDPLDYPCEECGAEAGEECRPCCIAAPEAHLVDET